MNTPGGHFYGLSTGIARSLCRHRRAWPIRWFGRFCYLFYRAYENRDFDFRTNGEEWCLRQLAKLDMRCAFDVGANMGDWTGLALEVWPNVTIHAFEIVPENFRQLSGRVANCGRVKSNPVGLSDTDAEIKVYFSRDTHYRASAYSMPDVADTVPIPAKVITGDSYVLAQKVGSIDYLKIDVEGMEGAVLRGLKQTLSEGRVRVIQFEYNTPNIVSGFLLRNAYEFLSPLGYRVGKLYPNYVDFRPYELSHEDFCGPNFIAARADDPELLQALS